MRVRNPVTDQAIITTQLQRGPLSRSMGSGAGDMRNGGGIGPASATTSSGVDGDGNIYTIHPALYDVDNYDDPAAVYWEVLSGG